MKDGQYGNFWNECLAKQVIMADKALFLTTSSCIMRIYENITAFNV